MTRLNQVVALAEATDPATGLAALAGIDELDDHHLRWAVEADLLRRLGRDEDARGAYDHALGYAPNEVERRFLEPRRAALSG